MGNESSQQSTVYGGKIDNDICITWNEVNNSVNGSFAGREGHCACAGYSAKSKPEIESPNLLYVFGGVIKNETGESDDIESNELLTYNTDEQKWSKIDAKGTIPPSRAGASICCVGKHLYLFGGLNHSKGFLNKVYRFCTETFTWELVPTHGDGPSARDKQGIAVIGSNIYLFGGFGPKTPGTESDSDDDDEDQNAVRFGWFDNLYVFDTTTATWSNAMQFHLGGPTARAALAMCALDKYLVVFGGKDATSRRNDLHLFNTETRRWETDAAVSGRQPEPRSFHSLAAVDRRLLVFGGRGVDQQHFNDLHIFDAETRQWLQPKIVGRLPAARGVHTTTVVGGHLFLYGGSSNFDPETMQCRIHYNDFHSISIGDISSGGATKVSTPLPTAADVTQSGDDASTKLVTQTLDDSAMSKAKKPKTETETKAREGNGNAGAV